MNERIEVERSPKASEEIVRAAYTQSNNSVRRTTRFIIGLMQMILESEGIKVLRAADGEEAVEAHAQNKEQYLGGSPRFGLPK